MLEKVKFYVVLKCVVFLETGKKRRKYIDISIYRTWCVFATGGTIGIALVKPIVPILCIVFMSPFEYAR